MKPSFSVHTDGLENLASFLPELSSQGATVLAQAILKDTRPFVPARTLSLAQRAHTEGGYVVYPGPYARYLYYGKAMEGPITGPKTVTDRDLVFSTAIHGDAQAFWFEASKAQNLKKWEKVVRKLADG